MFILSLVKFFKIIVIVMYGKKLVPVRGTVYKLFNLQSVSILLNLQTDWYSRFFQNINMPCALIGLRI